MAVSLANSVAEFCVKRSNPSSNEAHCLPDPKVQVQHLLSNRASPLACHNQAASQSPCHRNIVTLNLLINFDISIFIFTEREVAALSLAELDESVRLNHLNCRLHNHLDNWQRRSLVIIGDRMALSIAPVIWPISRPHRAAHLSGHSLGSAANLAC